MPNLSLAIIDSDSHARDELAEIIGTFGRKVDILAATANFEEGIRSIQESQPQIVILDVREVGQGAKETSTILARSPKTTVFVTCDQKNPDWILRLIRAGAGEYLTKPVNAGELVDAVKKVTRFYEKDSEQKGSAISVYSPTGGVGTTTTAVNLAFTLAARGEEVVLIDLNLLTPDIATFLDLTPRYTLTNIISRAGELDASFLRSLIVSHSSGIHVLTGPVDLAGADRLHPEQVHKMIAVMKSLFSYTVVDTGGSLSRCNLAAFHDCEHILYTTVLNLPGLKNTKLYLTAMNTLGFGPSRVKLVINRFLPKDDIDLRSAERILNVKAYATLPNTYADAKNSINRGAPLVCCYPRSQIARAMDEMTGRLMKETAVSRKTALQKGV